MRGDRDIPFFLGKILLDMEFLKRLLELFSPVKHAAIGLNHLRKHFHRASSSLPTLPSFLATSALLQPVANHVIIFEQSPSLMVARVDVRTAS